jgi:hypothetical protein
MKLCLFLDRGERRGVNLEQRYHANPATQRDLNGDEFSLSNEAQVHSAPVSASPALLKVHQELCEIDTSFGQLDDCSIFAALDRAGVLAHRFAGVDNIEHALAQPPAIGRARLRGECVQRFAGQNRRYSYSWRHVIDREKNLLLDISDPFMSEEKWRSVPADFCASASPVQDYLRQMLSQTQACHDRGNHESAAQHLRELAGFQNAFELGPHSEYLRLRAWIQSRRGFLDGILALNELAQLQPMTLSFVNDYVCSYRYQGLMPPRRLSRGSNADASFLLGDAIALTGPSCHFLNIRVISCCVTAVLKKHSALCALPVNPGDEKAPFLMQ